MNNSPNEVIIRIQQLPALFERLGVTGPLVTLERKLFRHLGVVACWTKTAFAVSRLTMIK